MAEAETGCQLYAVVEAGEAARERLQAAFSAAEIAAVLIVPAEGGTLDEASARPLVEHAQRRGAAALVAGDTKLARTLQADGVHLRGVANLEDAYRAARGVLGRNGILGIDAGISRHDAMTVAEAGADYVAFGAPAHLGDRDKGRARRDELIAWWAEIFQVPCVALDVHTPDEAQALARVGADFIGLALPAGQSAAAARDLAAATAAAISKRAMAD